MLTIFLTLLSTLIIFFTNSVYAKPYGATLCNTSNYSCYVVKKGDSWEKLFPDKEKRDLVMRINRMNTKLYSGLKIAIPISNDDDHMSHSPLPQQMDSTGEKLIVISMPDLAFGAYDENGDLQHWGPVSGGRDYCADINRGCRTPAGKFYIYNKGGSSCVSSKYPVGRGGAPMPYCMFFRGGFALHGSYIVPGYHDSHGCIRLFIDDAQWLNNNFTTDSENTAVIIIREKAEKAQNLI